MEDLNGSVRIQMKELDGIWKSREMNLETSINRELQRMLKCSYKNLEIQKKSENKYKNQAK